MTSTKSK